MIEFIKKSARKIELQDGGVTIRTIDASTDLKISFEDPAYIYLLEDDEIIYNFDWRTVTGSYISRQEVLDYLMLNIFTG